MAQNRRQQDSKISSYNNVYLNRSNKKYNLTSTQKFTKLKTFTKK